MPKFEVTASVLNSTATDIENSTRKFRTQLDDVSSIINNTRPFWESDAASEFFRQYAILESNLSEFDTVLNKYSAYLRETAETYVAADNKIKDETAKINADSLVNKVKS